MKENERLAGVYLVGLKVSVYDHLTFVDPWVEISETWGCKRKWIIGNDLLKVFCDNKNICRVTSIRKRGKW